MPVEQTLLSLAERLQRTAELSLLSNIPIPCPGGYTYLDRGDLEAAAAALRAKSDPTKEGYSG